MKTAIVRNGVVWNVVEGAVDPALFAGVDGFEEGVVLVDVTDTNVSPDDTYNGATFTRPKAFKLRRSELLARFTDDERADMELASVLVEGEPQGPARQRALIAQFLRWLEAEVDLLHPSVNGVRGALVALGVLSGQRVAEIFNPR